jgi:hypothetical protein
MPTPRPFPLPVLLVACALAPAASAQPTAQWSSDYALPTPEKRATEAPRTGSAPQETFTKGEKVQVVWTGHWYAATVLDAKDGRYLVHYDRFDSSWDEWVGPDRIRKGAPAPPAIAKPTGRFLCQTFEANELRTQGEILMREDGSYREVMLAKSGTWKFDAATGEIRFSGVLANGAKATYDPAHRHGMITFDWGGGVKRWCYR